MAAIKKIKIPTEIKYNSFNFLTRKHSKQYNKYRILNF